jgi:hypothetical protein
MSAGYDQILKQLAEFGSMGSNPSSSQASQPKVAAKKKAEDP